METLTVFAYATAQRGNSLILALLCFASVLLLIGFVQFRLRNGKSLFQQQVPERPRLSPEIVLAAAHEAAAELFDDAELIAQKAREIAFVWDGSHDGAYIAQRLQDICGWDISDHTAYILNDLPALVDQQHQLAIAHWVDAFDIHPEHGVDDVVRFPDGDRIRTGVIKGFPLSHAGCYIIDELDPRSDPHLHRFVPFEAVEPLLQTA